MAVQDRTIPLDLIRRAASTIRGTAIRTPLVRLDIPAPCEIYLKLENLQPTGAFKIRGAAFGVLDRAGDDLSAGVWAASSGNMASALAYVARRFSIPCTVLMPDTATETKVRAVERMGARAVRVGYSEWWQALIDRGHPQTSGVFFHGFDDPRMMAADGTIGLEIAEDLPDVDAVVVPFGGGGLACGIGSALKQAGADARILAAEFDQLAPLTAALAAGSPVDVHGMPPRFLGGVGGPNVVESMWALAGQVVDGAVTASLDEIVRAIRVLATRARVVAEGAGAVALACAMSGKAGTGKVVCIVSGGNIDASDLAAILSGQGPPGVVDAR